MTDRFTAAGLAAAVAVGRRLGLPHDDPQVLATKANVLVRMGPVVARVPATTLLARADTAQRLACDVILSTFLADRGAPVVAPWEDPGPHFANGLPVTLWPFTRHDPGHRFTPAEVAAALAELHGPLREFPGELPTGPVTEVRRWLDRLDGDVPVARLREILDGLVLEGPVQALHGDAHVGNLLATPAGPRWLDFEDTCRGPLGWDLACLALSGRVDGRAAVAAYPGEMPDLAPFLTLRSLLAVCWRFVVARRFPERLGEAHAALAEFVGTSG
ncbi:phosphotransferase [Amycolatopsis taiwanensis]|uniref:Aminoglycoside phosphotransferase domain-containing protein n=1 Tax=Amycolatopsis taiwanensis TaxID=342230 RepID=A0A9W6QZH3_9PSEU|nr:phosphotransferase [Amycolatopsis taiwanensis]GLY66829.1 hypothetical protein Atai01_34480 [Amycolatopsis taiwanensis]